MPRQSTRYSYKSKNTAQLIGRGRFISLSIIVTIILLSGLLLKPNRVNIANDIHSKPPQHQEKITFIWPPEGQAAVGNIQDGLVDSSTNANQPVPIASITKIITALVLLEKHPLKTGEQGPTYTIGTADIDLYNQYIAKDGTVFPVRVGQQLTLYQVLQSLVLPSANNIADSVAIWEFGSIDAYVQAANDYIKKNLKLNNTIVADPSGFSPDSKSSAADLIPIGQATLKNSVLGSIVVQQEANIAGINVKNTNFFVRNNNGVGIKIGMTDEAGYCLLFAIKSSLPQEQVYIGALLGQSSYSKLTTEATNLSKQILTL